MRKWIVTWMAAAVMLMPVFPASAELVKIADNIYSYIDAQNPSPQNSFGANAGIIIGKDGVVVVDTLVSSKAARGFIEDIQKITDKPIKYVINTHYHLDHAFGNSEFEKLGATLIGHDNCRTSIMKVENQALKNAESMGMTPHDLEGTKIAWPKVTFNKRMSIDIGGEVIELIHFGPSHTPDNILVYIPEKQTLFSGDILFTDFHPFMGEGDLPGWLNILDYILYMNVEKIIPGHGPLSTKTDVKDMKAYLTLFDHTAKELCSKLTDAKAIEAELLKVLPKRSRSEFLIGYNIQMKYLKPAETGKGTSFLIEIKDQPVQPTLMIRTRTPGQNLKEVIPKAYSDIMQYLGEIGEKPAGTPYAAYYNMDMQNLDVEIGIPVAKKLLGIGDIQAGEIPQGKAVTCLYVGPYEKMESAYTAISKWMKDNGYEPTGVSYEFYLNDPAKTPPNELKTQIQFPIKAKPDAPK